MAMNSKRKTSEDSWASNESLKPLAKRSPGRPKKVKVEEMRNVQLRLPVSLIDEIDTLLDGESRHQWLVKAIKEKIYN